MILGFFKKKYLCLKAHSYYAVFFCNLRQTQRMGSIPNGFHTHSLRLTQHPIDVMLQFDANVNAHANLDAGVNGPLPKYSK